jgi:hypothetical protein
MALECASNLVKFSPTYEKTYSAVKAFLEFASKAEKTEDQKTKLESVKISDLKTPSEELVANSIEQTHEFLKAATDKAKLEQVALKALENDSEVVKKVYLVENTHRLLVKKGEKGEAYFKKAGEMFKWSAYFSGCERDRR